MNTAEFQQQQRQVLQAEQTHQVQIDQERKERKTQMDKMQKDIEDIVKVMSPAADIAGGMLTRYDILQIINKSVTQGALMGWHRSFVFHDRKAKLTQLEQENQILMDRVKELEMEVLARQGK